MPVSIRSFSILTQKPEASGTRRGFANKAPQNKSGTGQGPPPLDSGAFYETAIKIA